MSVHTAMGLGCCSTLQAGAADCYPTAGCGVLPIVVHHGYFQLACVPGTYRCDAVSVPIHSRGSVFRTEMECSICVVLAWAVSQRSVKVPNNTVVMTGLTASEAETARTSAFEWIYHDKHERRCLTWQHHDGHEFVKRWPNLVRNWRAVGRSRADSLRHLQGSRPAVRRRRLSAGGGRAEIIDAGPAPLGGRHLAEWPMPL